MSGECLHTTSQMGQVDMGRAPTVSASVGDEFEGPGRNPGASIRGHVGVMGT